VLLLRELLVAVPEARLGQAGPSRQSFSRASVDTRDITGGELFFALIGARDGHDFLRDAVRAGAGGVVVSRDDLTARMVPDDVCVVRVPDTLEALQRCAATVRRERDVTAIAVTGSVGKTTTKAMIAHLLGTKFEVLANRASFNNHLGVPLTLTGIDRRHSHVVAEIGTNHRGEIAQLARLVDPDVAVVSNVGYAHIGNFDDHAALALEKTDLLRSTRPGGVWVVNGDDPVLAQVVPSLPGATTARVVRYGFGPGNDVRASEVAAMTDVALGASGTVHVGLGRDVTVPFSLARPGRHLVADALAAVAVAVICGIQPEAAAESLRTARAPVGRADVQLAREGLLVVDDTYNASPDAVLAALGLLQDLPAGVKVAVLGDMRELGRSSAALHERVGALAALTATHLVTVGEDARPLFLAAVAHGLDSERVHEAGSATGALDLVDDILGCHNGERAAVLAKGARFRHMERVPLGLTGRRIACGLALCARYVNCAACPDAQGTASG
jgi:UDP-N-acetylmuramoyl-tripeptide--D-alanyl-D-alanine ligase